jgi:hypothetical protein
MKGKAEITRQFDKFAARHKIFRAVCLAKSLADGEIHFRSDDVVLESSSGAQYTVDFAVPAGHKDQLDYNGGGDIIGTAWDAAGALILRDLDEIRIAAQEEGAEEPRHIWLHGDAKQWLRANTELKGYIQATPEKANAILDGSMIEDLNGWTWHFFSGTYTASDGTAQPYIPRTKAIITPDVGPWLKAANGSELIPTQIGVFSTPDEALANAVEIFGDFAYVALEHNPLSLRMFMGTNFIHAFANPNAVWMPTVDF